MFQTYILLISNNNTSILCKQAVLVLSFSRISNLTLAGLTITSMSGQTLVAFENVFGLTISQVCILNLQQAKLTNIWGNSMLEHLSVEGRTYIKYTDFKDEPPSHYNSLAINHSNFLYNDSAMGKSIPIVVQFDFFQSTYSVRVVITRMTANRMDYSDNYGEIIHFNLNSTAPNEVIITGSTMYFVGIGINIFDAPESKTGTPSIIGIVNSTFHGYPNEALHFEVSFTQVFFTSSTMTNHNPVAPDKPYMTNAMAISVIGPRYSCDFVSSAVVITSVLFVNNHHSTLFQSPNPPVVYLENTNNVTFIDCAFYNNRGTAIYAFNTNFFISGTLAFIDNTAFEGGALSFYGDSHVYVSENSSIAFANNSAEQVGGAVFVSQDLTVDNYCFLQFLFDDNQPHPQNCPNTPYIFNTTINVTISFINNTAQKGGDAIYGASLYSCDILGYNGWQFLESNFTNTSFHPNTEQDPSVVSSDPARVCLCNINGTPDCTVLFFNKTVYPGEDFSISAAVVGDQFGTVDGSVYTQFLPQNSHENSAILGELQSLQQTNHERCTNILYYVASAPAMVVLVLTGSDITVTEFPSKHEMALIGMDIKNYRLNGTISNRLLTFPVYINVTLLPCPLGFVLSNYTSLCVCDPQLLKTDITCNITTQTIQRSGTIWVGIHNSEVVVLKYCPFGYCKSTVIDVNLKQPDTQCAFKHSGILCGACQPGLSFTLGSNRCLPCSNSYLVLLLAFAFAGLALVFFIKVLNLTVAQGTINGLIFYANVIWANRTTFFPAGDTNPLTVFIAWLNLDFGIETCFFNGLDAYWKTWLQFNFIWIIVALIVILSRYSAIAAKLIGNNSVPVIATLFLLSYAKIQRAVITAIAFNSLELPDGSKVAVWSFDGNIQYLGPKHLPLFVFAILVLLFIWLPYTMTLLFAQCIQRMEHHRIRRWMLRLKPFFDAYAAPFNDKHRYWVGALLLARGILLLIVAIDPNLNDNLLAVVTVAVVLLMYTANLPHVYPGSTDDRVGRREYWVGSVYKKWYLSLLESSFIFNLAVLSAATLYVNTQWGSYAPFTYISVGVALCQFIGMVIFHAIVELRKCWQKHQERQMLHQQPPVNREEYEPLNQEATVQEQRNWPPVVRYNRMSQLREPLLEYEEM